MPEALDSVKALIADYRRFSRDSEAENPIRAKRQAQVADNLELIVQEVESARKRLRPLTELGDLSDLPEEVLRELNLAKVDELEQQLRDIVASASGGEVGIDQIIVELWRRHKVAKARTYIMNKLYRMAQKNSISGVEGKKGVYCVPSSTTLKPAQVVFQEDIDAEMPF